MIEYYAFLQNIKLAATMFMTKTFIALSFFAFAFVSLASAQNTVTVNQQGNGNTATINQSANESEAVAPCPDKISNTMKNKNIIIVKNQGKTTLKISDSKKNSVHGLFNDKEVDASQNGSFNLISALFNGSYTSHTLLQNGNNNIIEINPCGEQDLEKESGNNTVAIQQEGNGNSASISQR